MMSVLSLISLKLRQENLVVKGLPLNVSQIILISIFSMLFSDFRARGLRSIATLAVLALKVFFYVDAGTNVESFCWRKTHIITIRKVKCRRCITLQQYNHDLAREAKLCDNRTRSSHNHSVMLPLFVTGYQILGIGQDVIWFLQVCSIGNDGMQHGRYYASGRTHKRFNSTLHFGKKKKDIICVRITCRVCLKFVAEEEDSSIL